MARRHNDRIAHRRHDRLLASRSRRKAERVWEARVIRVDISHFRLGARSYPASY